MKADKVEPQDSGAINYGDREYWDERYQKKKGSRFQWLEPYDHIKAVIEQCLPRGKESTILNVGCGNSTIQEQLYADGYHNTTGNDISAVVIEQMRQSQKEKGMDKMRYDVMDIRKMDYKDQSFDLIIDKSTIDSLMCSDHPLLNVAQLIQESYRLLKDDGIYLAISYSDGRMEEFMRGQVKFGGQRRVLRHKHEQGHEVINHLYRCRKKPMEKLTEAERNHFYNTLKELQQKQYPAT